MDMNDLFMGERLQYQQILQRVLLPNKSLTEQGNHIQQPDNKDGQGRQDIPQTNYK